MRDEDKKEKIEEVEEELEELKKEYVDQEPDRLHLFVFYQNIPDPEDAGLIFLDPTEYTYYYTQGFEVPEIEMNQWQSPSRQAINTFHELGFDAYKEMKMIGRQVREYADQTEYFFQIEVEEEQTKLAEGNWIEEADLDNYTNAETYFLR